MFKKLKQKVQEGVNTGSQILQQGRNNILNRVRYISSAISTNFDEFLHGFIHSFRITQLVKKG